MSQGHLDDIDKTIKELRNPSGLKDGINWLRHGGQQAQIIDEMFLTGATKQDVAQHLIKKGISKRDIKTTLARVQRHIDHLRKEEHMLPLEKDSNGVWRFHIKTSDETDEEKLQKKYDKSQSMDEIPTREEIEKIMRIIGREVQENVFKQALEADFAQQGRKLQADWWEITKENLIEWSRKG